MFVISIEGCTICQHEPYQPLPNKSFRVGPSAGPFKLHPRITNSCIKVLLPLPPLAKKIRQKSQFFLIRKFWIGKDPPPFQKKNRQFLITEILDWVRPPPPFGKKIQKNFNLFLIRKFWIRRDPPPLSDFL